MVSAPLLSELKSGDREKVVTGMGTGRNLRVKTEWVVWLTAGLSVWIAGAFLATVCLDRLNPEIGKQHCVISCLYLIILLAVMAIGNFARVRTLLALEMLYGSTVFFRSIIGTLTALLILENPLVHPWNEIFDALVRPLTGLEYVAAQLTSHFVTEIYWVGLGLSATIVIFLACVSFMAVSSRIVREEERVRRKKKKNAEQKQKSAPKQGERKAASGNSVKKPAKAKAVSRSEQAGKAVQKAKK